MCISRIKVYWSLAFFVISLLSNFCIPLAQAAVYNLPQPSKLLIHEGNYSYPTLLGLTIDPKNPLKIDFIVDGADAGVVYQEQAQKIISYFFAGLTMPNDSLWVNLSPYEKDRIMDEKLAQTSLGKAMLEQDYILKQLSSSLTHPETATGKDYWEKIKSDYGADAFNKIWISPDRVEVHEKNNTVMITKATLKAELEGDHQAAASNGGSSGQGSVSSSLKDTVLPEIINELQNGEHFAPMRQIYSSLILSMWFKKKFKESFFKAYFDQSKISGIQLEDSEIKEKVFNLYVEAFQKGVYDFVKKEYDRSSRQKRKTRYFAGGATFSSNVLADEMIINDDVRYNYGFIYDKQISVVSVEIDEALERTYMAMAKGSDELLTTGYESRHLGSLEEQNLFYSRFNRQRLDAFLKDNPAVLEETKRLRLEFENGVLIHVNSQSIIRNKSLAKRYSGIAKTLERVVVNKTKNGYELEDKKSLGANARAGLLEILPSLNKSKVNFELGVLSQDVIDVAGEFDLYAWENGLDLAQQQTLSRTEFVFLRDYANGKVSREQLESEFVANENRAAVLEIAGRLRDVFIEEVRKHLYKEQVRLILEMYEISDTEFGPLKDYDKITYLFDEAYEQKDSFDYQRVRDFIESKDIAELMRNFGAKYKKTEDIPKKEKEDFIKSFVRDFKRTVEGFDSYVESVVDLSTTPREDLVVAEKTKQQVELKEKRKQKVSSSLNFYQEKTVATDTADPFGGVNLKDMDIQTDVSSSLIEFAPFDMKNFHGLSFNINSIQKTNGRQIQNLFE